MNAIRSTLVFTWLVLSLIPCGIALLIASLLLDDKKVWWWFAVPWLKGVVVAARLVGGVKYRLHGEENLPAADDMRRVILCPKHQSTWETFFFPSMTSHPLAYVFKKELLRIPFFGWSIGALNMIHIDRSKGKEAWNKVAEQGRELMDRGKWMIMFPEGTRTERGNKGSYKAGARAYPSLVPVEPQIPDVAANQRAWEVFDRWQKPFICCFSDGDPITRGGDKQFLQRIPGTADQPHTTLRGGHFIQEDDPRNFARLAIEACGRKPVAQS